MHRDLHSIHLLRHLPRLGHHHTHLLQTLALLHQLRLVALHALQLVDLLQHALQLAAQRVHLHQQVAHASHVVSTALLRFHLNRLHLLLHRNHLTLQLVLVMGDRRFVLVLLLLHVLNDPRERGEGLNVIHGMNMHCVGCLDGDRRRVEEPVDLVGKGGE